MISTLFLGVIVRRVITKYIMLYRAIVSCLGSIEAPVAISSSGLGDTSVQSTLVSNLCVLYRNIGFSITAITEMLFVSCCITYIRNVVRGHGRRVLTRSIISTEAALHWGYSTTLCLEYNSSLDLLTLLTLWN